MPVEFVFNQTKCTGCQACVLACTIENELPFDHSWRSVYAFNERHYPGIPVRHISLACNHCDDPACLRACPADAYSKDEESGFVALDQLRCIGCRYCTWACPYGAPKFNAAMQTVGKCTFCAERQADGKKPACVELCPTGALGIAERGHQEVRQIAVGFPRTDLGPAISFSERPDGRLAPECSAPGSLAAYLPSRKGKRIAAALRDEWPLAVFTFFVSVLVAMVAVQALGDSRPSAVAFVTLAALAGTLSLGHLGKKTRAWRAAANPTTSWLTREVLMFGALSGTGGLLIGMAPDSWVWGGLALAVGFATLLSIDNVYASLPLVLRRAPHSAGAVLTAMFLTAVFLSSLPAAVLLGVAKLVLYVARKLGLKHDGMSWRPALSAVRLVIGFLLPAAVWILQSGDSTRLVIGAVLLGELIDRLEFYAELDIMSPATQMELDLRDAIAAKRPVSVS